METHWSRLLFFIHSLIQPLTLRRSFELLLISLFSSRSVMSDSPIPWTVACLAPLPWHSPGKNTGVCSPSPLQFFFPILGISNWLESCSNLENAGRKWMDCDSNALGWWKQGWVFFPLHFLFFPNIVITFLLQWNNSYHIRTLRLRHYNTMEF